MHTYEHVILQGRVDTYLIRIDSDCKILIYLGKQRSFCLTKISNMIVYRRKTKCSLQLTGSQRGGGGGGRRPEALNFFPRSP